MAATPQTVPPEAPQSAAAPSNRGDTDLQEAARKHLWMHFTRMGGYDADHPVPIIERGEGAYVYDTAGNRYLDDLTPSSASTPATAAPRSATRWPAGRRTGLHHQLELRASRAIELAERIAELAPDDLNHVFFVNSGSEAVEAALKLARNYHRDRGKRPEDEAGRPRDRVPRDDARSALGDRHPGAADPLRPLAPGGCHAPEHEQLPLARRPRPALGGGEDRRADRVRGAGDGRVRDPRAAPERRRVHPAAGRLLFQRVREICDEHDVLLISDEVICSWGRLGHYFGCERYGYQPDIITTAKALTSAYAPMGR